MERHWSRKLEAPDRVTVTKPNNTLVKTLLMRNTENCNFACAQHKFIVKKAAFVKKSLSLVFWFWLGFVFVFFWLVGWFFKFQNINFSLLISGEVRKQLQIARAVEEGFT